MLESLGFHRFRLDLAERQIVFFNKFLDATHVFISCRLR